MVQITQYWPFIGQYSPYSPFIGQYIQGPAQSITDKILATFKTGEKSGEKCKHEAKGAKGSGGGQEAQGAPRSSKETRGSQANTLPGGQGVKVAKSGSFKEERLAKEDLKIKTGSDTAVKSPKLSRTESMTERTVQKISKMVRGNTGL